MRVMAGIGLGIGACLVLCAELEGQWQRFQLECDLAVEGGLPTAFCVDREQTVYATAGEGGDLSVRRWADGCELRRIDAVMPEVHTLGFFGEDSRYLGAMGDVFACFDRTNGDLIAIHGAGPGQAHFGPGVAAWQGPDLGVRVWSGPGADPWVIPGVGLVGIASDGRSVFVQSRVATGCRVQRVSVESRAPLEEFELTSSLLTIGTTSQGEDQWVSPVRDSLFQGEVVSLHRSVPKMNLSSARFGADGDCVVLTWSVHPRYVSGSQSPPSRGPRAGAWRQLIRRGRRQYVRAPRGTLDAWPVGSGSWVILREVLGEPVLQLRSDYEMLRELPFGSRRTPGDVQLSGDGRLLGVVSPGWHRLERPYSRPVEEAWIFDVGSRRLMDLGDDRIRRIHSAPSTPDLLVEFEEPWATSLRFDSDGHPIRLGTFRMERLVKMLNGRETFGIGVLAPPRAWVDAVAKMRHDTPLWDQLGCVAPLPLGSAIDRQGDLVALVGSPRRRLDRPDPEFRITLSICRGDGRELARIERTKVIRRTGAHSGWHASFRPDSNEVWFVSPQEVQVATVVGEGVLWSERRGLPELLHGLAWVDRARFVGVEARSLVLVDADSGRILQRLAVGGDVQDWTTDQRARTVAVALSDRVRIVRLTERRGAGRRR